MDYSECYYLIINPLFKTVSLNSFSTGRIKLVYSDNLEDIDMQLLFYGFKIVKSSKEDIWGYSFYDIRPV